MAKARSFGMAARSSSAVMEGAGIWWLQLGFATKPVNAVSAEHTLQWVLRQETWRTMFTICGDAGLYSMSS
jgi:hypothetical protein